MNLGKFQALTAGTLVVLIGIGVFIAWELLYATLSQAIDISGAGRSILAGFYFSLWAAISAYLFRDLLMEVRILRLHVIFLGLFLAVLVVFYSFIPSQVLNEMWVFQHGYDNLHIIDPRGWYVFRKSAEIAFQQVLIASGVIILHRYFHSLWVVSLICITVFGLAHLSQFVGHTTTWIIVSGLAAAVSSVAFPYLILRIPGGIAYTFLFHWLFYVSMSAFFLFS